MEVKCATMAEPWITTLVPANVQLLTQEALVKIVSSLGNRIDSLILSFHKQSLSLENKSLLLASKGINTPSVSGSVKRQASG